MTTSIRYRVPLSILAGVLLAAVSLVLLSYTVAISVPGWLLDNPLSKDNTLAALRLWDALVAYMLAVGIPSFVVAFSLFKFFAEPKWLDFACMLAGFLIVVHFVSPLLTGSQILVPTFSDLPWYAALFGNLVLGATAAMMLVRRVSYNNGFNSDAGKARAG